MHGESEVIRQNLCLKTNRSEVNFACNLIIISNAVAFVSDAPPPLLFFFFYLQSHWQLS